MRFAAFAALAVVGHAISATPQNFSGLECAVVSVVHCGLACSSPKVPRPVAQAQFGFGYATSKLPASAAGAVRDALNVEYLCANFTGFSFLTPAIDSALVREKNRNAAARAAALVAAVPTAPSTVFYVSTSGSDSNPGSLALPFATLTHAAAAVRALGPRVPGSTAVFVRAGTYYLGATPLVLSEADSNVSWAAYPGDAPSPVVLSGAVHLGALSWQPWGGGVPGIQVATVNVTRADGRRFIAAPGRAGPPPLVASLFVDGVRQVRARYPNGNPQDNSGLCFSATQVRERGGGPFFCAFALDGGKVISAPSSLHCSAPVKGARATRPAPSATRGISPLLRELLSTTSARTAATPRRLAARSAVREGRCHRRLLLPLLFLPL